MHSPYSPRRRQCLVLGAGAAIGACASVQAQPARPAGPARGPVVAQIVDLSPGQQDVTRDFLVGSRTAWQDLQGRGGLRGRPVQFQTLETDGSPAALAAAVRSVLDNPACVALSGTAGSPAALQVAQLLRQAGSDIAHVAPWLQNSERETDERSFPIFAGRQEQIAHALKSLGTMGISEVGAVFATRQEQTLYADDVQRSARELQLKVQSFEPATDLRALGQRIGAQSPAVLLFVGATPELAQFTQGLERQQRQRYVVALADVNPQTLQQLGAARNTPVVVTQAVPLVNAGLPVVRQFREALARLFDEPPSPLSLSGYIAARYTIEILQDLPYPLTRASVLSAFQRRQPVDLGGFRVSYQTQRRVSAYVTQSMLTSDGRIVG